MNFEEFLEVLNSSKEIIDWKLLVLNSDNQYSNGIIDGKGTDRTLVHPVMGSIYEGIFGNSFCPISAVYYLTTGKYLPPPNYFFSRQSEGGLNHPRIDQALNIDRSFGHRIAVASFNWQDSKNYQEGDREKLLETLELAEYVYKPRSKKKEETYSSS